MINKKILFIRFGYETLEKTRAVWNRTRAAGIPFVMCFLLYKTHFKIYKKIINYYKYCVYCIYRIPNGMIWIIWTKTMTLHIIKRSSRICPSL